MTFAIRPPPPVQPKGLQAWVWHPRADVAPKLCRVLRVLKGTGKVVIANDSGSGPAEFGIPAEWLFTPPDAESVQG